MTDISDQCCDAPEDFRETMNVLVSSEKDFIIVVMSREEGVSSVQC